MWEGLEHLQKELDRRGERLENLEASAEVALLRLDAAREGINKLLGKKRANRTVLADAATLEELLIEDIDGQTRCRWPQCRYIKETYEWPELPHSGTCPLRD